MLVFLPDSFAGWSKLSCTLLQCKSISVAVILPHKGGVSGCRFSTLLMSCSAVMISKRFFRKKIVMSNGSVN